MATSLGFKRLASAVSGNSAALRCRTTLQPAGGEGDKVFPPTYMGSEYALEERRVPHKDTPVTCVLLDSVQSQANRMEEALQQAIDNGRIVLPLVIVDFADADLIDPIGRITSLEAPHRIADAILRDSLLDGRPFRASDTGKTIDRVDLANATPLFDICPTALIFGMWDSTGPKGGLGAKFARALVSEIIGYDVSVGIKTSSRIDPLQIRASAKVVKAKDGSWRLATDKEKDAVAPSEINHGNIPPDRSKGGVTISRAEQTTVVSLPALRRLRFPVDGKSNPDVDNAARTVLAAIALCAAALAAENGFDLRSRCLLWPTQSMQWEILGKPGDQVDTFELTSEVAIELLGSAVKQAEALGLPWRTEPLYLKPSQQLVQLLRKSQELAAMESVTKEE